MTIQTLGLMDDEDIELDMAGLALSELDHPGIELSNHINLIREIAEELSMVGAEATTSLRQAEALTEVLHGEFGFDGDRASYDAPVNGDMVRVLDRRLGLPVSISILYASAARRVGWRAEVLNTPAHVLLRVGVEDPVIIDPFNAGRVIDPGQLMALLQRAQFTGTPGDAAPMSNQDVLVRLLLNQASRAEQSNDAGRAMTLFQRMTMVAPGHPDGWWSLGRLQLAAGMIEEARRSLTSMIEITRDPARRDLATAVLDRISTAMSQTRGR